EIISDFKQDFNNILEIGSRNGFLGKKLKEIKKSNSLVQSDCSFQAVKSANYDNPVIMDDELLPFCEKSFDLIVSNCNLHFLNDLPGFLLQIRKLLKEKGFFIATFFGGETLKNLREVFYQSELECYGGVSPRIIPFIDVKT